VEREWSEESAAGECKIVLPEVNSKITSGNVQWTKITASLGNVTVRGAKRWKE
jgi:hypothetical protein